MAPQKAANAAKAKKVKTHARSGIVKPLRNARGYHKFKSGMLNVTPKGDEKELVESNRDSPLLRLPPELRNRIWEYVLGGKVFRASYQRTGQKYKLRSSPTEPENCMALLQTCRQIYSEGAMMPLPLSTFTFEAPRCIKRLQTHLKAYQRKQIVSIQLELENISYSAWFDPWYFAYYKTSFPAVFPGLKEIRVLVLSPSANTTFLQEAEDRVRNQLAPFIRDMPLPIKIVIERANQDWRSYELLWRNTPTSEKTFHAIKVEHILESSSVFKKC